ncbi:NADPH-dependent FMN reductase [Streptomyces roseicoloratus]|uniref:NAD(P)H-dependent oxidoreductase n=1 Tax=Streptomyces roseicoloratus TaxID=2508722 RepID=A0ABY9S0H1_9ACTN|nr:NAD(P)H-dependent oxidoreductase [Streptomyces roseicoloratus]WMX46949.1 NAD(P)H-dependent oxidoreductase [Streptomyces roseicoloratus]
MSGTTATTATATTTAATAATHAPLRVVVLVGSVRDGSTAPAIAAWFTGVAEQYGGLELDVLDLAGVDLPLAMPAWGGLPSDRATAALDGVTPRLAAADAFVVVTPEYNHSFPAALKNVIDWHRPEWPAKPVGFVSYGGIGGGLRAVEQLRLVFAEMHATTVRDSVSLHGPWSAFGEDGAPRDAAVTEGAAKGMLGQLVWWGRALRTARAALPYQA